MLIFYALLVIILTESRSGKEEVLHPFFSRKQDNNSVEGKLGIFF